jgi:hypothetical protein
MMTLDAGRVPGAQRNNLHGRSLLLLKERQPAHRSPFIRWNVGAMAVMTGIFAAIVRLS